MGKYELLQLEKSKSDSIGILTINRPQALNALNQQVLSELEDFFSSISNSGLRCLILTGAGEKAFVAGADIAEMKDFGQKQAKDMALRGQQILSLIEDSPIPVIAAVNGFALGGGMELAMACDFIIASHKAKFGLPEVSLGIMPGYGGTQRLSRNIGLSRAKYITLSGDIFSAQKCYEWGVVSELCEPEELIPTCLKIADILSLRAPQALSLVKQSIQSGAHLEMSKAFDIEAEFFGQAFETEDKQEGVQAFLEKRKPTFQGK